MKFSVPLILEEDVNSKLYYPILFLIAIPLALATEGPPKPQMSQPPIDSEKIFSSLADRLQSLEAKTTNLNSRIEELQIRLDQVISKQKLEITEISAPVTDRMPAQVHPLSGSAETEGRDPNPGGVSLFRKGLMHFRTEQLSEAILTLTEFIEKNPDHILAGSAQFYVGDAYFKQKEYRLAIQEFRQVLAAYPFSIHVSETLNRLASSEDALKNPQEAMRYRQLLTSTFPQSPAAAQTRPVVDLTHELGVKSEMRAESPPPTAPSLTKDP